MISASRRDEAAFRDVERQCSVGKESRVWSRLARERFDIVDRVKRSIRVQAPHKRLECFYSPLCMLDTVQPSLSRECRAAINVKMGACRTGIMACRAGNADASDLSHFAPIA